MDYKEITQGKAKYHLDNAYFEEPLLLRDIELLQIGRLYCLPSAIIDTHSQGNLIELTIITSGIGSICTNNIELPVKKGDIYVNFPYDLHKIVSDKDNPLEYDFFAFRTDNKEFNDDFTRISHEYMPSNMRIIHDGKIEELVRSVLYELKNTNLYSYEIMSSMCEQLIIRLIRAFSPSCEEFENSDKVKNADTICYQAMTYIDAHIFTMKSLTEVTEAVRYNYSYLSGLFKKITGQTLLEYYRIRRLQIAKRLISEDIASITEISEMLNYSSVYSFSRAFKAQFGVSPNQYRKNDIK